MLLYHDMFNNSSYFKIIHLSYTSIIISKNLCKQFFLVYGILILGKIGGKMKCVAIKGTKEFEIKEIPEPTSKMEKL